MLLLRTSAGPSLLAADSPPAPGLKVVFTDSNARPPGAVTVSPQLALYVLAGQAPNPFLPPGQFTATWTGLISSELRREYRFQAELHGWLKLEINGHTLLETNLAGGQTELSPPLRLQKGSNTLRVQFRSPESGDAVLRVFWIQKRGGPAPVPASTLSHATDDPDLALGSQLQLGRQLVIERRCVRCHAPAEALPADPELTMEAPDLDGIGSRLQPAWMAAWILNPKAERSTARMPQLLQGSGATDQATAVAAFLASLTSPSTEAAHPSFTDADRAAGASLFDALHCAACHLGPDAHEPDPARLSLKHVPEKFQTAWLIDFLRKPETHFAWIRMPNFHLSEKEASDLAAFLIGKHDPLPQASRTALELALVTQGKKIVQTLGCLSCHPLGLANESKAKPLRDLPAADWERGCLAETPSNSPAPFFGFTAVERRALQHWAASDRRSLARGVRIEFAERQRQSLRCEKCHGQFDGFPPLDRLDGKLRPEWFGAFVAGRISYKPRPWLPARMPSFPAYAEGLAAGFAMRDGLPPQTPPEPPVDPDRAKVGRQLVSTEGGLSCVACHAVGAVPATQVFDNAGINFAYVGERLLKSYFERWLRNPLAIDPVTKMPAFFDEDLRSPLTTVDEGDGTKQMEDIWQYLRFGEKMPPPQGSQGKPDAR